MEVVTETAFPAPARLTIGIKEVIEVSGWAVSFPNINGRNTIAAHEVFVMSHQLKMGMVHTRRILAEMVRFKPVRDWADMLLIRPPMCEEVLIGKPQHAVAIVQPASPYPTRTKVWTMGRYWAVFIDVLPKALFRCKATAYQWVAMVLPALVMHAAPAALSGWITAPFNAAIRAFFHVPILPQIGREIFPDTNGKTLVLDRRRG